MEILGLIFRPEVMVFLVPITVIGGYYLLEIQKQKVKLAEVNKGTNEQDPKVVQQLVQENREVKERLGNLEAIITSMDQELLSLKASGQDSDRQKVEEITKKLS